MTLELVKKYDLALIGKLVLLIAILYFSNLCYISITDKGGHYYSSFLADHFNYTGWVKSSLLIAAKWLSGLFGIATYLDVNDTIRVAANHRGIILWNECVGYGIICFWMAFVIVNPGRWTVKLIWILLGIALVWMINCIRITLLVVVVDKNMYSEGLLNHHTLFNIATYIVLITLLYYYNKTQLKPRMLNS